MAAHGLELTFDQLALIYKSLLAVKVLGALPPEDETLDDTLQLIDQALDRHLLNPLAPAAGT